MKVWWCVLFLLQGPLATAQCPPQPVIGDQLGKIARLKAGQPKLDSLIHLRERCQRCHYADDSTYIRLLNQLVSVCFNLADMQPDSPYFRRTEPYLQEAIRVGTTPYTQAKAYQLANSYYYLGILFEAREDLPQSVDLFDKAIRLGKRSGKTGKWAYAYLSQALDYYKLGDYERSIQKARIGSYYYRQGRDDRSQAQCMGLEALALGTLNQLAPAAQLLIRAIHQIRSIDARDMDLGDYYVQLGDLQAQLHQPRLALVSFQKALDNFTFHQDAQGVAVYNKIGYLHLTAFKDTLSAGQCFQRVIRQATSPYQRAKAYTGRGDICRLSGQFSLALTYYQRGLRTLPINFAAQPLARNPSAISIKTAAYKDYLLTLIQNKADTWLAWAKRHPNRTYLHQALQTYQLADQMIDYMRWEQSGQQSKLYWRQKTHSLYERAIETSFRLGTAQLAYHFMEKSRAVMLADNINELGARQHLPPLVARLEYQIRQRTIHLQNQLLTCPTGSLVYGRTRQALLTEQERLDSLIRALETTNAAYYHYKYTNAIAPLPQVQRWLGQRETCLLSYFVGDSGVYVVGITPRSVQLHRTSPQRYTQTVQSFMRLLAGGAVNNKQNQVRLLALSNELYQALVKPINLPLRRVIVSSDGDFIPFETLSRNPLRADYLVKQYAFSYTYSLQGLLKDPLRGKAVYSYLGMAPGHFNDIVVRQESGYRRQNLPALRGSAQALLHTSRHYDRPLLLRGKKATRSAFQHQLPLAHVVQLFTHADAPRSGEGAAIEEPTLFLADSALRLSELQTSANLATQLIILMACKTGQGINQTGEGVFSLARGFASLGVPSILTTLWSVEDQATYQLSERFQAQLAAGLPKDVALQQAKLQFYEEASTLDQLPQNWAGIILIGNADPLAKTIPLAAWIMGLGLISVAVAGWYVFRQQTSPDMESALNP
jgi:CHAT domain-containing protein